VEVPTSVMQQLVLAFPQAASHVDESGCLPLHLLAAHTETWNDDVQAVFDAHPAAVQTRAAQAMDRRLPLHFAAANPDARDSLLARLVELHPRGASMVDASGKLPLHLVCEHGKAWEAGVEAIYQAFILAVQQPEGSRHWLPLHLVAAGPNSDWALIRHVLELYPAGAAVADAQGRYPLHLACRSGHGWESGLRILLEAHPEAICLAAHDGLVPLHIVSLRYAMEQEQQPPPSESVECESTHFPTLPFAEPREDSTTEATTKVAAELDVIFNILRADPTVLAM
jgi:hypothetical protein